MTDIEQEYFQICAYRKLHPLTKTEYGEVHHILPKSCGGPNRKWNLVRLTPEEHYHCHCLLPRLFEEKGMVDEMNHMLNAWHCMCWTSGNWLTENEYGDLKRKFIDMCRSRKHTEETKKKIGAKSKGRRGGMLGKHHTAEARKKISEARKKFKLPPRSSEYCQKRREIARRQWQQAKARGQKRLQRI